MEPVPFFVFAIVFVFLLVLVLLFAGFMIYFSNRMETYKAKYLISESLFAGNSDFISKVSVLSMSDLDHFRMRIITFYQGVIAKTNLNNIWAHLDLIESELDYEDSDYGDSDNEAQTYLVDLLAEAVKNTRVDMLAKMMVNYIAACADNPKKRLSSKREFATAKFLIDEELATKPVFIETFKNEIKTAVVFIDNDGVKAIINGDANKFLQRIESNVE